MFSLHIFETCVICSKNNSTSKYKQILTLTVRIFNLGKTSDELRLQFNARQSSTTKFQLSSVTFIDYWTIKLNFMQFYASPREKPKRCKFKNILLIFGRHLHGMFWSFSGIKIFFVVGFMISWITRQFPIRSFTSSTVKKEDWSITFSRSPETLDSSQSGLLRPPLQKKQDWVITVIRTMQGGK